MKFSSLEDLGWRFFVDEECTIPFERGDKLQIKASEEYALYYACVPKKTPVDGKIARYTVKFHQYPLIMDVAKVTYIANDIEVFSSERTEMKSDIVCEDVMLYSKSFTTEHIASMQTADKDILGGGCFYESVNEAKLNGVNALYYFIENSKIASKIEVLDEMSIDGSFSVVASEYKDGIQIDSPKISTTLLSTTLHENFAINISFSVTREGDFEILHIEDGITITYRGSGNTIEVAQKHFMTERVSKFVTDPINITDGFHRLAVGVNNGDTFVLFDGTTVFMHKGSTTINRIFNAAVAGDVIVRSGPVTKTYQSDIEYDLIHTEDKNLFYGENEYVDVGYYSPRPAVSYYHNKAWFTVNPGNDEFEIECGGYYHDPSHYHPKFEKELQYNKIYKFMYKCVDVLPDVPMLTPYVFINRDERLEAIEYKSNLDSIDRELLCSS